jgi:hypothetical protein
VVDFISFSTNVQILQPLSFTNSTVAAQTRTNLGLGATSSVEFQAIRISSTNKTALVIPTNLTVVEVYTPLWFTDKGAGENIFEFEDANDVSVARANLGLGATNNPAFRGLTSDGNIVITNQSATNNGLLFIYRTNNEPFLGLANLIASNNTTISNETLFRVGVAEATNQSAQFGFRSTNTNGSGVAVFSVFGYNALMMIGADASTNAVIFSGGGTNNEVMTLIRDGATEFARPIRFSTNASTRPETNAPVNTTNVAAWVEMRIGTNSYRVPLYQ